MKKKNPIIATILSLLFGPFGYLYIGWKYFIMALTMVTIFIAILALVDLDPAVLTSKASFWVSIPLRIVLAWKAYKICSLRNNLIDTKDKNLNAIDTFPFIVMATSDLLVGMGTFYVGAIGIYASIQMFFIGNLLKGFLYLLIVTPILIKIAEFVFGLIAMGIDALFIKKIENIFRK